MKRIELLFAALGLVGLMLLMSAKSAESVVVTPQTEVKEFRAMFGIESEVADYIRTKTKQGWTVKAIALVDDESWSKGVVVMEKY